MAVIGLNNVLDIYCHIIGSREKFQEWWKVCQMIFLLALVDSGFSLNGDLLVENSKRILMENIKV